MSVIHRTRETPGARAKGRQRHLRPTRHGVRRASSRGAQHNVVALRRSSIGAARRPVRVNRANRPQRICRGDAANPSAATMSAWRCAQPRMRPASRRTGHGYQPASGGGRSGHGGTLPGGRGTSDPDGPVVTRGTKRNVPPLNSPGPRREPRAFRRQDERRLPRGSDARGRVAMRSSLKTEDRLGACQVAVASPGSETAPATVGIE